MTTITREEVKAFIEQIESDLSNGWEAQIFELKLARIALASLDAEPVFFIEVEGDDWIQAGRIPGSTFDFSNLPDGINKLYAAPPAPVIQDDWVMVPKKLTAENGAKSLLSGEFLETTFISCPECFADEECESCDGSGRIKIEVPVSWTTIKAIWNKGVEHFVAAPQQGTTNL
ncbi:molecular chaperone DnaJ [Salmonella enterica]|nr:molecular chaperone DnaJ [Salmonella enterica]EBS4510224.1 molecular chaperone DnaJ [Salmonella enterica subsp. enterica serovar Adamstua]EDW4704490.1 molecular chaperone DnaJ [Salmonella enterica subsp. enterica]EAV5428782.1 molecular chaperone DnaJ [Salmonella enterica]EBH2959683.1 molecular chaperone DnaJ [Salmonella enterica]